MSSRGMTLRSGRVLGLAPPPGPPAPPLPIPPGPVPPGIPALNTFHGLPRALRMAILQALFQGQPRVQVERHLRPASLGRLCLVSRMIKDEATEAYLTVNPFQVTIVSAFPDFEFYNRLVAWRQGRPPPLMGWWHYTIGEFRRRVRTSQPLFPSQRSRSWGAQGRIRMSVSPVSDIISSIENTTLALTYPMSESRGFADHAHRSRTAGEFPWTTCPQWLKDGGPFIRDIQFDIIYPMPGYPPWVAATRTRQLLWDQLISGTFSVQVGSPGGVLNTQTVMAQAPFLAVGIGGMVSGIPDPANPLNLHPYQGQCQRAGIEADRVRQSYLPAAPPPGAPGFTGFTLRDLRTIAKAFSEPSIYVIQD